LKWNMTEILWIHCSEMVYDTETYVVVFSRLQVKHSQPLNTKFQEGEGPFDDFCYILFLFLFRENISS
jgi:hypothetical protein